MWKIPRKKLGQYSQFPGPCAPEQEAGVSTNEQDIQQKPLETLNKNVGSALKKKRRLAIASKKKKCDPKLV
jgi:hypothetical protein